jgi:hypothetical protein
VIRTEATLLLFLNALVVGLLVFMGWTGGLVALLRDQSWLVYLIAAATGAGVLLSWARFYGLRSATEHEAYRWVDGLTKWAEVLTGLAIVGTASGLVYGLSGYASIDLGDPAAAASATGKALAGVAVALENTLVGISGYIWLRLNAALLETAASKLFPEQSFRCGGAGDGCGGDDDCGAHA